MNQEQQITELRQQIAKYESMDSYKSDEIDIKELWNAIWAGKLLIVAITAIFSVASVLYALSLPDIYKSEATLAPVEKQSSGLGGMASQLGGLASLAGVSLGGEKTDKTSFALEVMKSRAFVFKFIEKYNITEKLMAVSNWDPNSNEVIYNEELYNPRSKEWLRNPKGTLKSKPSLQEVYKKFQTVVSIEQDKSNSMVTISVEHFSPYIAKQWVEWLIYSINEEMKHRELDEATKTITYLNKQLGQTKISGHQEILYQLIEEQTKTIMFANVRDEYVLKTIDPALSPEIKSGPKRAMLCVLGFLLGGILSVLIVLIRYFSNKD